MLSTTPLTSFIPLFWISSKIDTLEQFSISALEKEAPEDDFVYNFAIEFFDGTDE